MGGGLGSRTNDESDVRSASADEEALLDEAMQQADGWLMASLQREELRRRRRRRWALGGVAMTITVAAVVTGLILTGGTTPAGVNQSGQAEVVRTAPPSGVKSMPAFPRDVRKATGLAAEGWELWRKRQYAQAEEKFDAVVKLDPESTNAWSGLGWSRFNGGDSLGGEKAFKRCLELDPGHPAAQNGLGQIYFFRRQYDKAKEHWLPVAERTPASWYGLTKTYLLEGDFEKAAKWAKKVVGQQPDDPTARMMLEAAQAKELSPELRKLIEPPDPMQQSPETKKGWQFFNQGELPRAMSEFRKALKKNSTDANAHNGLGFCLLNSGKADQAKKHFEVCLALAPEHAGAMNGLARCLKAEGKVDEAIALWEKMVEQYPGPNAGTWGLAETYLEQKQYDKAVRYFEQLTKANPDDASLKQKLQQARAGAAGQQ